MKRPAKYLIFLLLLFLPRLIWAQDQKPDSLCQFHYPSDYLYEWKCVQLTSNDSPRRLFGKYWLDGLRFNRVDRRHFTAGLWVKVPRRIADIRDFTPLPEYFMEGEHDPRFILIDQDEMFLGAYEFGRLVFSAPVAVGMEGYRLQNGLYRIDGADSRHESNVYLMEGTDRPYPMHYALRVYTDKREDGWSTYWLHGRDVPGYPASHGCIGLYDEEMQREYYREPETPVLMDAKRLYDWVLGDMPDTGTLQPVKSGPRVLIIGTPPEALDELEENAIPGAPPGEAPGP